LIALGRLGQFAGLVLLVIGVVLAAWGAPYYMLDWGGTFLMAGIALASAGLSCLLLGTVLRKLAALQTDLLALRADAAVSAHQHVSTVAPEPATAADTASSPHFENGHSAGSPAENTPVGGLAGMAVAGVAASGIAATAKSILTSVSTRDADTPAHEQPDSAWIATPEDIDAAITGNMVSGDIPDGIRQTELTVEDRASLDDLLAKLALPLSNDTENVDSAADDDPASDVIPATAPDLDADDLYARIDDAARALQAQAADADGSRGEREMEPNVDAADAVARDLAEAAAVDDDMAQRIDDEFAGLRAELSLTTDKVEAESDERSENPAIEPGIPADTGNAAAPGPAQPDPDAEASQSAEPAGPDQPDAVKAGPPVSGEGVVAAYNVGDTSYAMFADGRIRVSAPEGEFMMNSMAELKSFMAARRSEG
jgi:hypothetical protein